MAEDKFEIRPNPFKDQESLHIATPDFGSLLQRDTQNANQLKGASGLLAKGILPEVKLALQETAHKPDDKVHKELPGIGKLDLTYDDQGKLASAHLDYGRGNTEDAKFVDGHIVENRLHGKFDADYRFNADGTVSSEFFRPQSNSTQYYEFDKDGTLTLATGTNADHSSSVLRNEPGAHDIESNGPNGYHELLHYDNNQHFQNGELRMDGNLYGLKPSKNGGADTVPEREA